MRVGVGVKYGVDSYFGSATQASVKAFQRYKGLPVTGVVDQATAAALGFAAAPAPAPAAAAPGTLARGAIGQPVKQLQQALINAGVTVPGGVDGIFGRGTEGALKTFQQSKGLGVTGTVDPRTAAALVAGRQPGTATGRGGAAGRPRRRSACASAAAARPSCRSSKRCCAWAGRCAAAPTGSSARRPRASCS